MSTLVNNDITNDVSLYIEELQRYLRIIQRDRLGYTNVPIDGIFGSDTAEAVRQVQREVGLPANGVVDRATWDAIATIATAIEIENSPPTALVVYRRDQPPLTIGATGDDVYILQSVLQRITRQYRDLPPIPAPDGRYSDDTAALVRSIQQRSSLPETGDTDRATWDAIARLYNNAPSEG